ncbi:MAG: ABC transporter permease [Solirubrobacteraceae bacterium]
MRRVTVQGMLARKLRLALTALAIVLGVTFVTGTLVLGDTLNRTFNNLIGTAYQHISFEIRGHAAFSNASAADVTGSENRKPIAESIATTVARLPGVAYVHGNVEGYAQFMARGGDAIGGGGGSTLGFSFDPNRQLSPYRLVQGRSPTGPGDVVMDKSTATKDHFSVGQRVLINLPNRPQRFTITGIVTFGSDDNLAGVTLAGFSLPTAQALFNAGGHFDSISVLAKPGADTVALQRRIAVILPPGVQVISGQALVSELSNAVDSQLSFISTALLIFGFIALFVGAFTIFNTFSITVGQRTRELALLRIVGASRRQLFRSVLEEAALTGFVASLLGLGLGVLAALGLKALLNAFNIVLPSSSLVFEPRTPVVAICLGVGVTVISAILPARRALRIAPVAALVEQSEDAATSPRRSRVLGGVGVAGLGVIALVAGLIGPTIALVGMGATAVFIGAGMLAPVVARPLSSALGRPLSAMFGTPGQLARENAMRNPLRTAQTAAALMIGLALVSTIAVLGASISASVTNSVDSAISADYIVSGNGGFSRSAVSAVSRVPGVTGTTTVYQGQFEFRSALSTLTAVSTAHLSETIDLHVIAGRGAPALAAGQLLIDSTTASSDTLHVGSIVPVRFAQTGPATMRVGGIFKPNPLAGSFFVADRLFLSHFDHPLPVVVLLRTAAGTRNINPTLNRILNPYANVSSKTRAQFESNQKHQVDQLLGLIYVLLALAVAIALIGIVNTLVLSVFERTHEIGLLRAVGMKRRQVKSMIRAEAVIIALFGAVVGIVIGTALGAALASALRDNSVTTIAIPISSLIAFLILSALLGLAAAGWPARRAAKLDVLTAIAAE